MLTLYTWTTPNGRKVPILLEELELPYQVEPIDISNGKQFAPSFLAISPNNKIPALVDDEAGGPRPLAIFESGAILTYLAEKTGRFLAPSGPARWQAMEWLHWQIGGLGPMLGQLGHFASAKGDDASPQALKRFVKEADRLLGVLDKRLSEAEYLAGDEYSIADIAAYPWTIAATTRLKDPLAESLASKKSVHRWLETLGARPAVQRGMQVPEV